MQYYDPNAIYGRRLSIGKASKYLGVSIDTLRRWVAAGKLKTYRSPGGHRYFDKLELDEIFGTKYERYNEPVAESKIVQPTQTASPQQSADIPKITPTIPSAPPAVPQIQNYPVTNTSIPAAPPPAETPPSAPPTASFPATVPDTPSPHMPQLGKWEQIHPQPQPQIDTNENPQPTSPDSSIPSNIPISPNMPYIPNQSTPHVSSKPDLNNLDKQVDFITSEFNKPKSDSTGDSPTQDEPQIVNTPTFDKPIEKGFQPLVTQTVINKPLSYEEKTQTETVQIGKSETVSAPEKKEEIKPLPPVPGTKLSQPVATKKRTVNKGNLFLIIGIILFVLLDIFLFYLWYTSTV